MDQRKSRITKYIIFSALLLIFVLGVNFCFAGNLNDAFGKPLTDVAGPDGAGYNTTNNVEGMIATGLTIGLSFVGVVFLILAIYGGYIWMMARGNEQEVEKAKDIIKNSIIGLVVVIAAYAISWYIINALGNAALKPSDNIISEPK